MKIVIVGGGTAGWMTANLLKHQLKNIRITLIESPNIKPIGVGEGSTPHLKSFFDTLGVNESQWMSQCNATYKLGIEFKNWSTNKGFEKYFHPFYGETDLHTKQLFVDNCLLRRQGIAINSHPDQYFLASYLSKQQRIPHAHDTFPFQQSYGYHFDSMLLGQYLESRAIENGVKHVMTTIQSVELDTAGNISRLICDESKVIEGDFYVDCSGFQALLIQKALAVPWVSFKENLFNNSAIVIASNSEKSQPLQTTSTALTHGWQWSIPLTNRIGNGYVYSSDFCSADEAEIELRTKLSLLDDSIESRRLTMKVGKTESHWYKNCLAVGLSQGFIEPLEATALHLVQQTIEEFINCFDDNSQLITSKRNNFNKEINERIEGIRDYIVCHYRASNRNDSDYWRVNNQNENLSVSLKNILNCWLSRDDLTGEINYQNIAHYYSSLSWHCLLSGYGVYPRSVIKPQALLLKKLEYVREFNQRCAANFKSGSPIIPN